MEENPISPSPEPILDVATMTPGPAPVMPTPIVVGTVATEPEPADPEPEPDEFVVTGPKKEKKEKKHRKLSKKARLVIIIGSIVGGLAIIGVLLYFLVFRKVEPVVVLSDRDILVSHAWEKKDTSTVIWTFRADGTGELTTNKSNYYDTKWRLEQEDDKQILKIDTAWLYELNDSFEFVLDRENDSFSVKNLAEETESVFVPLGTAEQKAAEQSDAELEKTEE